MDSIYYSEEYISGIKITVLASSKGIRKIFLNSYKQNSDISGATRLHSNDPYLFGVFNQLKEYFAGVRKVFDLPLDIEGSDFQKKAWEELQNIPYGKTISYKKLSENLGDAKATRAVGKANSQNPIPIIIPCHRVIGAYGNLTGYAGGIKLKEKLLEIEGSRSLELFE